MTIQDHIDRVQYHLDYMLAIERLSQRWRLCGQCAHFERCEWLMGRRSDDVECDWYPSRYIDKEAT